LNICSAPLKLVFAVPAPFCPVQAAALRLIGIILPHLRAFDHFFAQAGNPRIFFPIPVEKPIQL
jgi:hypothetical protein